VKTSASGLGGDMSACCISCLFVVVLLSHANQLPVLRL